jgi:hypothetical protein
MNQQANGCFNGASGNNFEASSSTQRNGDFEEETNTMPALTKCDQDIVRLIGQHLKIIGLK